jgi:fibronectin type 3 domain-containing protein
MILSLKHLYSVILLLALVLMAGCNNPLDSTGTDKSNIDSNFSLFLEPPGSFIFTHSSVVSGQVEFSFGASPRAESYAVKYGLSSGSYTITSSCTSSPCTISGLTNGTNYFFTVVATNAKGSKSIAGELVLSPADAPTTPSGLSATVSSGNVALSWSASTGTGTITYSVYRSTTSGSGYSLLTSGLSSTSYSDSSVANGTNYYYEVTATNSNGTSGYSSEVSATPMSAPLAPTSLALVSGQNNIQLSWNASSGLGTITYNVLRSTTSGSGYSIIASNQTGISYADTTALAGTTYYYVVNASNAGGTSSNSSEVSGKCYQSFSLNIPFDALSQASYDLSNSSTTEFVSGVARLVASDQTDDDSTSTGFGGGTNSGTVYDSTNGYLRLNSSTNNSEFNNSWTPQYSNLSAYYSLNGSVGSIASGATVSESLGNTSIDGVTSAVGLSYATGLMNQGIVLDGTNYVDIPSSTLLDNSSKMSFSFWVKPAVLDGTANGVLCKRGAGADVLSSFCFFFYTNNNMYIDFDSSNNRFSTNTVFKVGHWYHIGIVYDGTLSTASRVKVYVNGVLDSVATETSSSIPAYTSNMRIGGMQTNGSFHGSMDEIGIWRGVALTSSELLNIYRRQSPKYSGQFTSRIMDAFSSLNWTNFQIQTTLPFSKELPGSTGSESSPSYSSSIGSLMSNLVAYWKLNETGGIFTDYSGNGNTGTAKNNLTNICTSNSSVGLDCSGAPGILNNGIRLTGSTASTSGYVAIANSTTLQNVQASDSTYSLWYNASAYPTNADNSTLGGGLLVKNGYDFGFRIMPSKSVTFEFYNSANTYGSVSSGTLELNRWYHLVVTINYTTGYIIMYLDGKQVSTKNIGTSYVMRTYSATDLFRIGSSKVCTGSASSYCYPANGIIDEVAIWSRALSSNEVLELYRRAGDRIKYQIRTCSSSDCSDQSSNSNLGWKGPDGTALTYFSELYNSTSNVLSGTVLTTNPTMTFSNFSSGGLSVSNNRYFQYRAILESEDQNTLCNYSGSSASCSPELKSILVGPTHYDVNNPTVTNKTTIGSLYQTLDTSGFTETLGSGGCTGIKYTISGDGTNFYYYNGSAWTLSDGTYTQSSSANIISTNLSTLVATMGTGTLQVKTFLHSDGVTACEVSNINVTGKKF